MPATRRSLVEITLWLTEEELELLVGAGGLLRAGGHSTLGAVVRQAIVCYGKHLDIDVPDHCFVSYDNSPNGPKRRPKS